MRRLSIRMLFVILATLWFTEANASVPDRITAQGRLTDASGAPLPAGTKDQNDEIEGLKERITTLESQNYVGQR